MHYDLSHRVCAVGDRCGAHPVVDIRRAQETTMKTKLLAWISDNYPLIIVLPIIIIVLTLFMFAMLSEAAKFRSGEYVTVHDSMRIDCNKGAGQWIEGSRDYYCIYPAGGGR